jgi:A/G-specific adenine glycosylase
MKNIDRNVIVGTQRIASITYPIDQITASFCHESAREDYAALSPEIVRSFRSMIFGYYRKNRRDFPWRNTTDPYHIFISEIMLQQTQTARVALKYPLFIEAFPTVDALASAAMKDILPYWQGLGYNRRAVYLHQAAQVISSRYGGVVPGDPELLDALPGIGAATASAIAVYAYNKPHVYIETNVRTVFLHFFFHNHADVTDAALWPLVEKTLPRRRAREWYSALMDYGVMLKKNYENPGRRSAHHQIQSRFEGSRRQIRGRLLHSIMENPGRTEIYFQRKLELPAPIIREVLVQLNEERLIIKDKNRYYI